MLDSVNNDQRWRAIRTRDATADGSFVFGVRTTGIYCRPGCPARTAKRENVVFFATCADAEAADYRACRRCHPKVAMPDGAKVDLVAQACRLIEAADAPLKLDDLARKLGLSASHLHRRFKAATGLTPYAYAAGERARRVRQVLTQPGRSVTTSIYDAGFQSSGRFYAASNEILGMTPSTYKNGGASAEITFAIGRCSLGALLVARSSRGLCAIFLGDDPDALASQLAARFPQASIAPGDAGFAHELKHVVDFIDAPQLGLDLPLDIRGTAFQQRVWKALRTIPAGETKSYLAIARQIGEPTAVRAVAQACGANKLAVVIPCHRVVRSDNSLSGYRWGIERKQALLDKERGSGGS